MFGEYFKPAGTNRYDYWFGDPEGEFTEELQEARYYALLLMAEIAGDKEYTPESP